MKILYVSKAVKPNKGGSVVITENLVRQFSSEEMAVVGSRRLFARKFERHDNQGPRFYCPYGEININGKGDRFFVPFRYILFPFLVFRIIQIYRREGCGYILASFPDIFYCYAAYVAARILKCRYSTYFHNTYLENRPRGHRNFFAKRWQPAIFNFSEYIFVMSEGMKEYFEEKYGSKYRFIDLPHTHTYTHKHQAPLGGCVNTDAVKLVLIGNFNSSNLDATRRLVNAFRDSEKYQLYFYTHVSRHLLKARGVDLSNVKLMGYVDDDKLLEELQEYDVCVLTHGFVGGYTDVEYRTIFPTRTIPFLLSGRPIFAHAPKECFLSDFLRKYDCAVLVTEADETLLVDRLDKLLSSRERMNRIVANAHSTAKLFEGKRVVERLKFYLNEHEGK